MQQPASSTPTSTHHFDVPFTVKLDIIRSATPAELAHNEHYTALFARVLALSEAVTTLNNQLIGSQFSQHALYHHAAAAQQHAHAQQQQPHQGQNQAAADAHLLQLTQQGQHHEQDGLTAIDPLLSQHSPITSMPGSSTSDSIPVPAPKLIFQTPSNQDGSSILMPQRRASPPVASTYRLRTTPVASTSTDDSSYRTSDLPESVLWKVEDSRQDPLVKKNASATNRSKPSIKWIIRNSNGSPADSSTVKLIRNTAKKLKGQLLALPMLDTDEPETRRMKRTIIYFKRFWPSELEQACKELEESEGCDLLKLCSGHWKAIRVYQETLMNAEAHPNCFTDATPAVPTTDPDDTNIPVSPVVEA